MLRTVPISQVESRLARLKIEICLHGRRVKVIDRRGTEPVETMEPTEVVDKRQAVAKLAHLVLLDGERVHPRWLVEGPRPT